MSDMGDFYREQREERRRLRAHWHECPDCAVRFGTGTSVPPGGTCHNCGWEAPGERGDDRRAADLLDRRLRAQEAAKRAKRERHFEFECPYCERKFRTPADRGRHVAAVHEAEHLERKVKMGKRKTFPELQSTGGRS